MKEITIAAHAKVNFTLDVTGKLPNGYHTVKMVMQTLALHDTLTITRGTRRGISIEADRAGLPTDNSNLAVAAAIRFFEYTHAKNDGVHMRLIKRIPVAAGLAGGSTDAAAALHALNALYETGLSADDLCAIGLTIGADVPYCIRGGSMLAEGIGEVLTPLAPVPDCYAVVCKPPVSVSTAAVYARMRGGDLPLRPDTKGMLHAIEAGDYQGICRRLFNVMEEVTGSDHTDIGVIKGSLLDYGADGAMMSGSGPTVFGLFAEKTRAAQAAEKLRQAYPETFLTTILPHTDDNS